MIKAICRFERPPLGGGSADRRWGRELYGDDTYLHTPGIHYAGGVFMSVLPVLLGGDANVYGMARSFWDCYHTRSAVLCCRALPALWGSRLLSCVVQEPDLRTEAGFVRALLAFAKRTPGRLRILIPCDDAYTWLLARHAGELAAHYHFRVPPLTALQALAVKPHFADACRTAGLTVPETLELGTLPEALPFAPPYVLKPADPDAWNAAAIPGKRKVYFLQTAVQLRETMAHIRSHYQEKLLLQPYVQGADTRLGVLNFYCPASGTPWVVQGTPLLQEPTPGGAGNYAAVLVEPNRQDAALIAAVGRLLQSYGWQGFANIDLKYAPDGTPVLFELNPRQGRASYACCAAGAQLARPLVQDILGRTVTPPRLHPGVWHTAPWPLVRMLCPDRDLAHRVDTLHRRGRGCTHLLTPGERLPRRLWFFARQLRYTGRWFYVRHRRLR